MNKSQLKKELAGMFNTVKEIDGVNIACVGWLNDKWLICEHGEKWGEVSSREYTPIASYHTVNELVDSIVNSRKLSI
jgi:hypothetical protein